MRKFIAAIATLVLSLVAEAQVHYVIECEAPADTEGTTFYLLDCEDDRNIGSATVADGHLRFEGDYPRHAFVRIEAGRHFSHCILDTLAIVDFTQPYAIGGSELNLRLHELMAKDQSMHNELEQWSREIASHGFGEEESGKLYKKLYDKLRPEFLKLYTDAIETNDNGVGEAFLLNLVGFFGLTPDEWDAAYARFPKRLKECDTAVTECKKFSNLRRSLPGNPFIDFEGKTPDGTPVKLSDYVGKGKYVLVDFWASWCGPCKKMAKERLIPLYEQSKSRDDFEILGVAVWDKPGATIKALETNSYPWVQIIDTAQNPMEIYGFNYVPMIILFAPDGTILARDLDDALLLLARSND